MDELSASARSSALLMGDAAAPRRSFLSCLCCCGGAADDPLREPLAASAAEEPAESDALRFVLREIVTTERAYVADITAITQFLPALRSAALPAAELDALVGNVDSLLLVHGELLGRLEAAGDSVVGFAHAFCSITPFLRMYSIYCARYGAVVGAVNAAAVNAAALAALEEARGERLDSLLVKPVQRICKYPLFFGELLKALPADCAERPQLQAVAEQVRQMGEEVNGRVKEADQEALKLKLYEELGGAARLPADLELLSPTRRLVAQADVRLARADVRAAGRRRRHRLALFSDVLLVARPTRKIARALAKGSKPPLELRAVLPMLGCRLSSDGGGKALVLSCELPRLRYKCACASPAAAQALLDAFAEAQKAQAAATHANARRVSLGPEDAATAAAAAAASAATAAAAAAEDAAASPTEASCSPPSSGRRRLSLPGRRRSSASSAAATLEKRRSATASWATSDAKNGIVYGMIASSDSDTGSDASESSSRRDSE